MIRIGAKEPEDCSRCARLCRHGEHVWCRKEHAMRGRMDQAAGIARAADACAESGNIQKAVEIALDLEQVLYEVNTFLNAASMMLRLWKT
jgi:hypothetical protein